MSGASLYVCNRSERRRVLEEGKIDPGTFTGQGFDKLYIHDKEEGVFLGPFTVLEHGRGGESLLRLKVGDRTSLVDEEDIDDWSSIPSESTELSQNPSRLLRLAFKFDKEEVQVTDEGLLPSKKDEGGESHPDSAEDGSKTDTEPNLRTVIAEGMDVEGRDFSDTKLPSGQRVNNQKMRDCDMSSISMKDATFSGVDLRGSSFRNADLDDVEFEDCRLAGVDFTEAKVRGAEFTQVQLTLCEFSGANLEGADFSDLPLERVDLSETYLNAAHFQGTNPERARFDRAEMEDVRVTGTVFEHSSFVNVDFKETDNLSGAAFIDCDLTDVDLAHTDLSETELTDTRFTGGDLRKSDFTGSDYSGLDFTGANLEGAKFDEATLDDARFTDARLSGATFHRCRLDGLVFDGAKVDGAEFDHANLERTSFAQAELSEVRFEGAGLHGALLASSRINEGTTFDDVCIYLDPEKESPPGIRSDVISHSKAANVYRTLETVHESNALSSDARTYHLHRRRAQRRTALEEGRTFDAAINLASDVFVDYGLRFRWLIFWSGVSVVGAAGLYALGGVLQHPTFGRLILGKSELSMGEVLLEALLFSLLSFTGLGYGGFTPVGWGKWLSVSQTGLGVLVFAMFVYIFTSRAAR